jgi:16S rRNA (uracil1498-N3)-methyltransferase
MHLFYTPDINSSSYTLSEEESKHCIRVLRLAAGDKITLMDGKGVWYDAEISDDHPKRCTVTVTAKRADPPRKWNLHIAVAPTKSMDRLEWFIEKATETGIEKISLLDCDTSERTVVKTERLLKVAVSAAKQSLKSFLPEISELQTFKTMLQSLKDSKAQKFIAHCHSRERLPHLKKKYNIGNDVIILVGPEGDFSKEEVEQAIAAGFEEISLGQSRLRTETAALYACSAINILNEAE